MNSTMKPRIFLNSFPKGGTNLVLRLLELCGYETKQPYVSANLLLQRPRWARKILRGFSNNLSNESNPEINPKAIAVGVDSPVYVRKAWLERYLSSLKDGQALPAHCLYTDNLHGLVKEQNIKIIQVLRDPRAIAVSNAHYLAKQEKHPMYSFYQSLPDFDSQLAFSITGGKVNSELTLNSIAERAMFIAPWVEQEDVLSIRFEDLIGAKGGGDDDLQRAAILQVLNFLDLENDDVNVWHVQNNLFGTSATFRQGQIDSWRDSFKEMHFKAYNAVAAELTKSWGYDLEP